MFKNSSTFYRIIIHTIGVLFLIGIVGSTAFGDDGILSTVVQTLYVATFGTASDISSTDDSSALSTPPSAPMHGNPGGPPPPPDTLQ